MKVREIGLFNIAVAEMVIPFSSKLLLVQGSPVQVWPELLMRFEWPHISWSLQWRHAVDMLCGKRLECRQDKPLFLFLTSTFIFCALFKIFIRCTSKSDIFFNFGKWFFRIRRQEAFPIWWYIHTVFTTTHNLFALNSGLFRLFCKDSCGKWYQN